VTVGSLDLSANKDIKQDVLVCEDRDKYGLLLRSLKENNTGGKVLIFVETKRGCDQLQRSLQMDGWSSCAIHGDKSQGVRAGGRVFVGWLMWWLMVGLVGRSLDR
jgi:ATP-dependent RNA helicase DDX5/DBP2